MGGCNCNCLLKNPESNNEMVNGIIPGLGLKSSGKDDNEIININTENDVYKEEEDIIEKKNNNNSLLLKNQEQVQEKEEEEEKEDEKEEEENGLDNLRINTKTGLSRNAAQEINRNDSSIASMLQELVESIFDYFNGIRTTPEDYEKAAEDHGLGDIIQKAINSPNPCNNLIVNFFYNLLLSSYINNNTDDGEKNKNLLEEIEKEEKIKNYNKKLYVAEAEISNPNEAVWNLIDSNKDIAFETFFSNNIEYLVLSCQKKDNDNKMFKCYFLLLLKGN